MIQLLIGIAIGIVISPVPVLLYKREGRPIVNHSPTLITLLQRASVMIEAQYMGKPLPESVVELQTEIHCYLD